MAARRRYIMDSDVFITAKNVYYAFDICPGFWKSLIHHHREGRVYSIDKIRSELLAGRKTEDLVQWVKNDLPTGFFLDTDGEDVTSAFCVQFKVVYKDIFFMLKDLAIQFDWTGAA